MIASGGGHGLIEGIDRETIFVHDAVALAIVGPVGNRILVPADAVYERELDAVILVCIGQHLNAVRPFQNERTGLPLGRERDIALRGSGPVHRTVLGALKRLAGVLCGNGYRQSLSAGKAAGSVGVGGSAAAGSQADGDCGSKDCREDAFVCGFHGEFSFFISG